MKKKVEGLKKALNFFCINGLEKWWNLDKVSFFFPFKPYI